MRSSLDLSGASDGAPSTRHRRALQQLQNAKAHDDGSAAPADARSSPLKPAAAQAVHKPVPAFTSTPQRVPSSAGKLKENVSPIATFLSSATAPATPQRLSLDASADESDSVAELRGGGGGFVSRAAGVSAGLFQPAAMPLTRATTPARPVGRDIGPSSGRIGEGRVAAAAIGASRPLFPLAGAAAAPTPASSAAADASLLHLSLAQILSSKENARKYIDLMRRKMASYMVLNKEHASARASEMIKNRGVAELKRALQARMVQMENMHKNVASQLSKKDAAHKAAIEAVQQELRQTQQANTELTQTHREAARAADKTQRDHAQALKRAQDAAEQQVEDMQRQAESDQSQLESRVAQLQLEKQRLQESFEQLEGENSQLKLEMRRVQPVESSEASSEEDSAAYARRVEIALENACNEVDRLQTELREGKEEMHQAMTDIHALMSTHAQMRRKVSKLQAEGHQQSHELQATVFDCRQLQIELDEAEEQRTAAEQAYQSMVQANDQLKAGLQQMVEDFSPLCSSLDELLTEQASTIPLPLEALSSHPELAMELAGAASESVSGKSSDAARAPSMSRAAAASPFDSPASPAQLMLHNRSQRTPPSTPLVPFDARRMDEDVLARVEQRFSALSIGSRPIDTLARPSEARNRSADEEQRARPQAAASASSLVLGSSRGAMQLAAALAINAGKSNERKNN